MIKTTAMLLDELSDYHDSFGRIKRLVSAGRLYRLVRAVYETDDALPGYLFAPVIYGPSYISFDYALSRYGLIPEAVFEYTSATFGKEKRKTYHNDFGDYSYRDIPGDVYPFEQYLETENGYAYFIAGPEKALCDKLYTLSPVKNLSETEKLLFENLRIDETEFAKLRPKIVEELSPLYKSNNIRFFSKFIRRNANEFKYSADA